MTSVTAEKKLCTVTAERAKVRTNGDGGVVLTEGGLLRSDDGVVRSDGGVRNAARKEEKVVCETVRGRRKR